MTTVNLYTAAPKAALLEPTCCDYLCEKIALVWEAVCAWIAALFSQEKAYPTVGNLPLPLWVQIINYNEAQDNARSVACVSPSFYQVYKKWLHGVTPTAHALGSEEFVQFYEQACDYPDTPLPLQKLVKNLQLAPLNRENFYKKITQLVLDSEKVFSAPHPALQELRFYNFGYGLGKEYVASILAHCPEIRILKMDSVFDEDMSALVTGLKKLEVVDITTQDELLKKTPDALVKHPTLKSVEFTLIGSIGIRDIQKIPHLDSVRLQSTPRDFRGIDALSVNGLRAKNQTPLAHLELIGCDKIDDYCDLFLFPLLRSLIIRESPYIGFNAFQGARLPELRELSLCESPLKGVVKSLSNFPKLEKLSLLRCMQDEPRELAPLGECQGLKEFRWESLKPRPFLHISAPLGNCALLVRVELANIQMEANGGTQNLEAFTQKLPHLREIDLRDSYGTVDKVEVRRVAESRPVPFQYWLPRKC